MNSILVMEDDPAYRSSISLVLQMEGFDVRMADNGADGITMVRDARPDLILCDIMMPGLDGYSVLETLKKNGTLADIPFIFVTALDDRADVRRGMSEGADDFLTKPFSAEELVAAVIGRLNRIKRIHNQVVESAIPEQQIKLLQLLTAREREILLLVGNGESSKEIAERLDIRINTVEVHRSNLMKKLKAENAVILARWAFVAERCAGDVLSAD
ncbi:MAG: response regulator transcription factor [Desulfuromonadaceae bacterium]|nr:response regulator transcription factor [Desulfuromonadaceae bacterium]MDD5106976.1 response regulator transcription factor [Desulfuromonadaceae bacterium]